MNSKDRANLIKRISTIEGLTDNERSALLGLLRENKSYGLVWEDKPEDIEERLRDELPILTEVPERAIISEDKDAPNHILIEGDNLEALATLAYTHEGEIDVIYEKCLYCLNISSIIIDVTKLSLSRTITLLSLFTLSQLTNSISPGCIPSLWSILSNITGLSFLVSPKAFFRLA